jgi:TetR/AcrR family transcriptional regulator, cholesterol catabolism regulator
MSVKVSRTPNRSASARAFGRSLSQIATSSAPAADKLRDLGIDLVRIIVERPDPVRVFMREWTALPEAEAEALSRERRKYLEILEKVLIEGCEEGSFVIANIQLTALQWISCHNYIFTWYSPDGELTPVEIADGFYDTFVRGIASSPFRSSLPD